MLKNLIFDFGGVLINLDFEAVSRGLKKFGIEEPGAELIHISQFYEKGEVSTDEFLDVVSSSVNGIHRDEVLKIWNETIADFPQERIDFLSELRASGQYNMFLLSNTNALHIEYVQKYMGRERFKRFHKLFDGFYLSHEIGMRKPEQVIFEFVLDRNQLKAEETLFIDDTLEHIKSASQMGIRTWHLQVGSESILELSRHLM